VTRRDFLLSAAAATSLFAQRSAASDLIGPIPAIDSHIHLYDPMRSQGVPWPAKNDPLLYNPHLPERFSALVAPFNVVGTVVVECSPLLEDNQWVLDLAKDHPAIVGFVGHLEPGKPELAGHLRRFASDPIFRGIRLHGAAIKDVAPGPLIDDLRRLSDRSLALDLMGNASMLPHIVRLAALTPELRLVINHLPFKEFDGGPAAFRTAWTPIAALPNVFVKISEVIRLLNGQMVNEAGYYRPGLDVIYELFGPDRVIFGSNWPVSDKFAPYANVYGLVSDYFSTKSRLAAEKFFWRNSYAAYRWQHRGAASALVL